MHDAGVIVISALIWTGRMHDMGLMQELQRTSHPLWQTLSAEQQQLGSEGQAVALMR